MRSAGLVALTHVTVETLTGACCIASGRDKPDRTKPVGVESVWATRSNAVVEDRSKRR